jgi:hypothetical protein
MIKAVVPPLTEGVSLRDLTELKSRLDASRLNSAWRAGAGQSLQACSNPSRR